MHLLRARGFWEVFCVKCISMWLNLHLVFVTAVTSRPLGLAASRDVVADPTSGAS